MNKKNNKKGFTLAELLIVVAIIAVLVAIAIPIFTKQLEKSRESTDLSNVRSAAAQVVATYLSDPDKSVAAATVTAKQKDTGWQIGSSKAYIMQQISGKESKTAFAAKTNGAKYTVSVNNKGKVSIS